MIVRRKMHSLLGLDCVLKHHILTSVVPSFKMQGKCPLRVHVSSTQPHISHRRGGLFKLSNNEHD